MSDQILDMSGLPCPEPVIKTKKYIEANNKPETVRVIVDNQAASENVTRLLKSSGYEVSQTYNGKLYSLRGDRGNNQNIEEKSDDFSDLGAAEERVAVVLLSDCIGSGDDELGKKLMKNFLATLTEFGSNLWRVILLNGGVRMTTADSPVLEQLQALEKMGAGIFVCGTCLNHFNIMDKKVIGETSNMLDVVTSMQAADRVIRM